VNYNPIDSIWSLCNSDHFLAEGVIQNFIDRISSESFVRIAL